MFEVLKIVHLIALGVGFTAAIANPVIMARAASAEGPAKGALMGLAPIFGMAGGVALILLWITGGWMLADRYDGWSGLDAAFYYKFGFVIVLTVAVGVMQYFGIRSRRTGTPPPPFVKLVGIGSSVALLAVVIFAVVAFN